nr:T6SS effector BTH_I2691 family protein [Salinisphaera sp. Q1T1-3]
MAQQLQQNAQAARACAASTNGDCPFCERQGLPILPLRYAVIPKALDARPDDILGGHSQLGEGVTDKPLNAHKYTLRTLREGFVQVYLGTPGVWQVYAVNQDGHLRLMPDPDDIDHKTGDSVSARCKRDGHNIPASFIHVKDPEATPTIYIAFSDHPWPKSVRDQYEQEPASRMQQIDCAALSGDPSSHPDAFEIAQPPSQNAGALSQLVEEFAQAPAGPIARRQRIQNTPRTSQSESATRRWQSLFGNEERSGEVEAIEESAAHYTQAADGQTRVAAFALHDPVGMVAEMNASRLTVVANRARYQANNARPHIVSQSIVGLKAFVEAQATAAHADEPDRKRESMMVWSTREERAAEDAAHRWSRLAARYDEDARAHFAQEYQRTLDAFQTQIDDCGADWARWAGQRDWIDRFGDFEPSLPASRSALIRTMAPCIAGGPTDEESHACWQQWLASASDAETNPVYRALFGDHPDLMAAFTPSADGSVNGTTTLYNTAKSLAQSDGFQQHLGEPTQQAVADIQQALHGAVSRLGELLSERAHQLSLNAQQTAVLAFARTEMTGIRVRMRVGDYYEMLNGFAFDPMRQAVTQTLKRGERTVRSMAVGGILLIDNAAVRNRIVDVVLWTTDSADDLRHAINQANRVGNRAASAVGDLLGRIRVTGVSLNARAAQAIDDLRIPAARLAQASKEIGGKALRVAGSGNVIVAAGAAALQGWALRDNLKQLDETVGREHKEAWAALSSATIGATGAGMELVGAGAKALGREAAADLLIRVGGGFAVAASAVDGVRSFMAAWRTGATGDTDAALLYTGSGFVFGAGTLVGGYAWLTGVTTLLGPFGWAIVLVAAGAILAWAAANAEDTQAEIWLDRCYFGLGERTEGKWTDQDINRELAQFNAILVGLSGEVGFNNDYLGMRSVLTDCDTVGMKLILGHFDPDRSAYEWTLSLQQSDGRWFQRILAGRHGVERPMPQMSALPDDAIIEDTRGWFEDMQQEQSDHENARVIHASVQVDTERFQNARLEATYWRDKADQSAQAQIRLTQD